MPIVVKLDATLVKNKISLAELSKAIGLSLTNLSMLKNKNVRGIRFETLGKICIVLNCQPGDLIISLILAKKISKMKKIYLIK